MFVHLAKANGDLEDLEDTDVISTCSSPRSVQSSGSESNRYSAVSPIAMVGVLNVNAAPFVPKETSLADTDTSNDALDVDNIPLTWAPPPKRQYLPGHRTMETRPAPLRYTDEEEIAAEVAVEVEKKKRKIRGRRACRDK
jgi:hypothetical protein